MGRVLPFGFVFNSKTVFPLLHCHTAGLSSVGCASTWYVDGCGFNPPVQQHSFVEIGHEIYWSKVLTDQQGLCRFFRKHKNSKISENSNNKTGDYSSFKFTKMFFQKKSLCIFLVQKMESTLPRYEYPTQICAFNFTTFDYPVYWTFKITLSSIGFEWKKALICYLWVLFVLRFISDNVFIKG